MHPEIAGIVEAFERGENEIVIGEFLSRSAEYWRDSDYEWKDENAERFSDFIQKLVPLLPADATMEKVLALSENYLLALVTVPNAPDLAASIVSDYWNKFQEGDPVELREYFQLLHEHPDSERIPEIVASTVNI